MGQELGLFRAGSRPRPFASLFGVAAGFEVTADSNFGTLFCSEKLPLYEAELARNTRDDDCGSEIRM